jgi:E3 ubiquitin-protein ligase NEDD4
VEDDQFGEQKTIDLRPNGREIDVTDENKKEYVE